MVFDDLTFDINCPGCRKALKLRFSQMREGNKITCQHCRRQITIKEDASFRKLKREAEKLDRTLKDIGNIELKIDL